MILPTDDRRCGRREDSETQLINTARVSLEEEAGLACADSGQKMPRTCRANTCDHSSSKLDVLYVAGVPSADAEGLGRSVDCDWGAKMQCDKLSAGISSSQMTLPSALLASPDTKMMSLSAMTASQSVEKNKFTPLHDLTSSSRPSS
jgi:hypothetical protein